MRGAGGLHPGRDGQDHQCSRARSDDRPATGSRSSVRSSDGDPPVDSRNQGDQSRDGSLRSVVGLPGEGGQRPAIGVPDQCVARCRSDLRQWSGHLRSRPDPWRVGGDGRSAHHRRPDRDPASDRTPSRSDQSTGAPGSDPADDPGGDEPSPGCPGISRG